MTPAEHEAIHDKIAALAEEAKTYIRGGDHYRATIILRATHLPDGDVIVTDDIQEKVLHVVKARWK